MAIEMIEESELSALASSRLGNKNFVDDDEEWSYGNGKIFGINVRGKKYHDRKRAEAEARNINANPTIDPIKESDCEELELKLIEIQNQIQKELGSSPSAARVKNVVGALRTKEAQLKNLVARNKCEDKRLSAQSQKAKEETLAEINRASGQTPDLAQASKIATQGGTTSKYLMWGIGGIVGIVTLVIVIKAMRKGTTQP